MNRNLLIVTLIALCLSGCGTTETVVAEPTDIPATQSIETPTIQEPVNTEEVVPTEEPEPVPIFLDLAFDDIDDADWLELYSEREISNEEIVTDGVLRMGDGIPLQGIRLRQAFSPGTIIHVQYKLSSGACAPIRILMEGEENSENGFFLDSCAANELVMYAFHSISDESPTLGYLSLSRPIFASADTWIDVIYWIYPEGDRLFYGVGKEDEFSYGSVNIPNDWQTDENYLRVESWFDPDIQHLDINSLVVSETSLKDYLEENLSSYQTVSTELSAILALEPQAFPELLSENDISESENPEMEATEAEIPETETPEPENTGQNPIEIISQWLLDSEPVFGENVEAMADNQGGQFGPGAMKIYNEAENVFTFSDMDGMIWTSLNTHLDQFGGMDNGGNQAILLKFQPSIANALQFTFMGQNEFGVEFWDEGHPSIFYMVEAYKEPFEGDFALQEGIWYNMLMAIERDGNFLALVWEDGNFENHTLYRENLSEREMGDGYTNASWKFIIGSQGPLSLNLDEYNVLKFSGFSK